MVVAVSTTNRVIISAKYRRKTLSGLEPSFMWDASLSFPLGPPVYVCSTLLWGQEGRVHCRVIGWWVCSPGPFSPASSSSEALEEIKLLDSWLLAVGGKVEVVITLTRLQNVPEPNWRRLIISLRHYQCVKNKFRYFAELLQTWPLVWPTHYATTHTDYQMITGKKKEFSVQHWI